MKSTDQRTYPYRQGMRRRGKDNILNLNLRAELANVPKGCRSPAEILLDFQDLVDSCSTAQRLADDFLKFLMQLCSSPCGCLRKLDGNELLFRAVCCHLARDEKRVFHIDDPTIITRVARERIAILEGDQSKNPDNPPSTGDTGSLISLTYVDHLHHQWQFTSCNIQKDDYFGKYHLAVAYWLFPEFTNAYYKLRFTFVRPAFKELTSSQDILQQVRICAETADREQLATIAEEVEHNNAYFIPADEGSSSYPIFLPTRFGLAGDATGFRFGQHSLLPAVAKLARPVIIAGCGTNASLSSTNDYKPSEVELDEAWPADLSIAVVPCQVDTTILGFFWLERHGGEPFEPGELIAIQDQVGKQSSQLLTDADKRRRRYFTCDEKKNPIMVEIADLLSNNDKPKGDSHDLLLLWGEHGVGKMTLAQAVHNRRERRWPESFRTIGSEDPPGKVFAALRKGGTVVLRHLQEFPKSTQKSLFRVLFDGLVPIEGEELHEPLTARIIATVVGDPSELIEQDKLDFNLFHAFRSCGFSIEVPPIRERYDEFANVIHRWLTDGELSDYPQVSATDEFLRELARCDYLQANFFELIRVVRLACRNAKDSRELRGEHMPRTFREELSPLPPTQDDRNEYNLAKKTISQRRGGMSWTKITASTGRARGTLMTYIHKHFPDVFIEMFATDKRTARLLARQVEVPQG